MRAAALGAVAEMYVAAGWFCALDHVAAAAFFAVARRKFACHHGEEDDADGVVFILDAVDSVLLERYQSLAIGISRGLGQLTGLSNSGSP